MNKYTTQQHNSHKEQAYWDLKGGILLNGDRPFKIDPVYLKTISLLGDLQQKKVLECGCGDGNITSILTNITRVWAFDISEEMLRVALNNVKKYGREDNFTSQKADLLNLPFEGESFDVALGFFILHHVGDVKQAGEELQRIIRPGGEGVFLETWQGNPLLRWLRPFLIRHSPSLASLASPDEQPLSKKDLSDFSKCFSDYQIIFPMFFFWQLVLRLTHLSCLRWLGRVKWAQPMLAFIAASVKMLDSLTYKLLPFLRKYSYYAVIKVTK